LDAAFKFITTFGDPVAMAYRRGQCLCVPRQAVPLGKEDRRLAFDPKIIDCQFEPWNPEQEPLINRSVTLLRQDQPHVLEAPTGWGKSVVGSVIACRLGQPTIILVQKQDLMDQWYEALTDEDKCGVPAALVGRVQQDMCDYKGRQFVLGMVQSVMLPDRYPEDMYRHFGLMVLDEVDTMAADQFVTVCWKFPARYRLGLTATPERSDGKWRVVEAHVGPVMCRGTIVPMKPKILVKKTGWAIPMRNGQKVPYESGRMMTVNKLMAASQMRNIEITEFVLAAYAADRTILVASDLKEHLDRLFQMFTSYGIPGEDIGYYVGGMSKMELEFTKKRRVVLGTYKMCGRGTNVPHWDTFVPATPRANIKQFIGRIVRYMLNKKQPVALDLVDYDKIFHAFHLARMKQYYRMGANIVSV
jgi:superfamily II DNA or RNA helicase